MADPVLPDGQAAAPDAAAVERIRQLLGEGRLQDARRLTAQALRSHPGHAGLLGLERTIAPGRVEPRPGRYPDRRAELAWIAQNRDRYPGKWVALVGDRVIAIEDDAGVLLKKLRQQGVAETPLVHHLV